RPSVSLWYEWKLSKKKPLKSPAMPRSLCDGTARSSSGSKRNRDCAAREAGPLDRGFSCRCLSQEVRKRSIRFSVKGGPQGAGRRPGPRGPWRAGRFRSGVGSNRSNADARNLLSRERCRGKARSPPWDRMRAYREPKRERKVKTGFQSCLAPDDSENG